MLGEGDEEQQQAQIAAGKTPITSWQYGWSCSLTAKSRRRRSQAVALGAFEISLTQVYNEAEARLISPCVGC